MKENSKMVDMVDKYFSINTGAILCEDKERFSLFGYTNHHA